MTQGQPGRPPPEHARRAPRHFVRDAVVFEDYTIAEGRVIPQGAPRTRYHPETCPALPQQLARLARGDTRAVLAFVRTYGLLGYASLAAAVGRGVPSDAAGDPLGWIWAQAETVALCLHLTYGLQAGDDAALQHSLRAVQLPQPPQPDGGPQLIVPAVWDQPRVLISWASPLHSLEDWRTYARAIRREVLNAHLLGIRPSWSIVGTGIIQAATRPSLPWSTGISSTSPPRGSSSAVPRPRVAAFCADAAHATVLSRGPPCARQPVCGARPEAGWAATSVDGRVPARCG
jgi:hypothetical protein